MEKALPWNLLKWWEHYEGSCKTLTKNSLKICIVCFSSNNDFFFSRHLYVYVMNYTYTHLVLVNAEIFQDHQPVYFHSQTLLYSSFLLLWSHHKKTFKMWLTIWAFKHIQSIYIKNINNTNIIQYNYRHTVFGRKTMLLLWTNNTINSVPRAGDSSLSAVHSSKCDIKTVIDDILLL